MFHVLPEHVLDDDKVIVTLKQQRPGQKHTE